MKKYLFLLPAFVFLFCFQPTQAQCPGCVVDSTCIPAIPNGGICQDTMSDGMVNNYYDEDVSFHMPASFVDAGTGYTIQLKKIKITGISGLPIGISWTSNSLNNEYQPFSNNETIGCIKFCGTPINAQYDTVTVFLTADVTALNTPVGNVDVTQAETYKTLLRIVPDTSGGPASFSYTGLANTCDSTTLNFSANLDASPLITQWQWDFGNGYSSNLKNPPAQHYSDTGEYIVTLKTTIYETYVEEITIDDVNDDWCGDIEEPWLGVCFFSPELYIKAPDINLNNRLNGSSGTSASFKNLAIPIPSATTSFNIEIWDEDNGPPLGTDDDSLGSHLINVVQDTVAFSGNGNIGFVVMDTAPGLIVYDTLIIKVDPVPVITGFQYSDTILCSNDTVLLSILNDPIEYIIYWYKDSTLLPITDQNELAVTSAGKYYVQIIDKSNGCEAYSNSLNIVKALSPPQVVTVIPIGNQLAVANLPANGLFDVVWSFNGIELPDSTGQFITPSQSGNYTAKLYNISYPQCFSFSDPVSFNLTPSSLMEISPKEFVIYPNPASEEFKILLQNTRLNGPINVQLRDMNGKILISESYSNPEKQINISIIGINSGTYIVEIQTYTDVFFSKLIKR